MSTADDEQQAAAAVLWHFNLGGVEPGSFTRRLVDAVAAADHSNRARLAQVYPLHVRFVELIDRTLDPRGLEQVRAAAGPFGRSPQGG